MSLLAAASVVIFALALLHSVIGERLILRHLPKVSGFPDVFGSDLFIKRTLRVTWHVPSILGFGLAWMTWRFAQQPTVGADERFVVATISISLLACALLALIGTRGRHPSWVAFLVAAILSGLAACGDRDAPKSSRVGDDVQSSLACDDLVIATHATRAPKEDGSVLVRADHVDRVRLA